ncbi:EamA family transporter [Streptomyces heilongjiangensis]
MRRWVALTAVAPVAWGANYYVTRQFLPADHPLWGAALRALPAGLLLMALSRRRPQRSWWWKSAVLGVLNTSAFFVLVYVASQLLATSVASMVMAVSPLVMMLCAWVLLRERPRVAHVAGALTGLVGVALMLGTSGTVDLMGVLASAAALLASSVGYVLSKRWGAGPGVLSVTAWQLTWGGLLLVAVAAIAEGAPPAVDAAALAGFGYTAFVATALAFLAWFAGLRHLSAGTVGLIGLLNPVTGVLLGTTLAAEALTGRQGLGMGLVLIGILLGRPGTRRDRVLTRSQPRPRPTVETTAPAPPTSP